MPHTSTSTGQTVDDLEHTLLEESDVGARAPARPAPERIALRSGRFEAAVRHFREALHLDPRLEPARARLVDLGEVSGIMSVGRKERRQSVRRLLRNFRRKG